MSPRRMPQAGARGHTRRFALKSEFQGRENPYLTFCISMVPLSYRELYRSEKWVGVTVPS